MEHKNFRACLSFAAQQVGATYRQLNDARQTDSMLLDAMLECWDAPQLAVNAIVRLIAGDKGRMDMAVCLAVVNFLDRQLGVPAESQSDNQRYRALADLVTSEARNEREVRRWLESWYV